MKRIFSFFSFLLVAVLSASALGINDGDGKPDPIEQGAAPSDDDIPKRPPILNLPDGPKPPVKPSPLIIESVEYVMDNCGSVLKVECTIRPITTTLAFSYEDGTMIQYIEIVNRNSGESVCRPALWDGSTSVDVADCQGVWIVYITTTDGFTRRASVTFN